MTLRELAEQYKSDVETRLKIVEDELANVDDPLCYDEDYLDDLDEQIAHWQATLEQINETLAKCIGVDDEIKNSISTLSAYLEEAHQDELDHNHYGDKTPCSYCIEIARAEELLKKL